VRRIGAQAEVLMPQSKGDYNDHAIEGELMPELNHVEVPAEVEWSKSEKGRLLNVKENVRAVLEINQIDLRYNAIKKDLEILIPHQDFVADLKKDASLVEVENRCRHLGVPATNVKDYLKLLAREYNPVREWMESKPWDGTSRLADRFWTRSPAATNHSKRC
jgi:predicted P-loop ATPase